MTNDEMSERLRWMQRMQELLESDIGELQSDFYRALINRADQLGKNAASLNQLFEGFYNPLHRAVIQSYAEDLFTLAQKNDTYYKRLLAEEGTEVLTPKLVQQARKTFTDMFGISKDGELIEGGYIDLLAKDQSIKLKVSEYVYKSRAAKLNPTKFAEGLDTLINDQAIVKDFYSEYVVETYQLADRQLQQGYADQLGFTAFIYAGGTISTSRQFCRDKNGKTLIVKEILAWQNQKWKGKSEPYVPMLSLGGYGCRHSLNGITNKMAMARRSDLAEDEKGHLYVKTDTP